MFTDGNDKMTVLHYLLSSLQQCHRKFCLKCASLW